MFLGDNGQICIEKDDQCGTCTNGGKRTEEEPLCPLLEALVTQVVFIDDAFGVRNCDFYKKKESHLRVL